METSEAIRDSGEKIANSVKKGLNGVKTEIKDAGISVSDRLSALDSTIKYGIDLEHEDRKEYIDDSSS